MIEMTSLNTLNNNNMFFYQKQKVITELQLLPKFDSHYGHDYIFIVPHHVTEYISRIVSARNYIDAFNCIRRYLALLRRYNYLKR
jgi:hypothetical protein